MKGTRCRILVWSGIAFLILFVSTGCGHKQEEGGKYETQSNMEETSESWHGIPSTGDGKSGKAKEHTKAKGNGKQQNDTQSKQSDESQKDATADETTKVEVRTQVDEYWTAETSAVTHSDDQPEESESQGEFTGGESESEEAEGVEPAPYYLTEADKSEVIAQLVRMGESYGLIYYPNVMESETWDSPTPIYEEELILGREYVISTMVEYTEGAFALMQMEGCTGFALNIKEQPNTVTGACYEVYVYWL